MPLEPDAAAALRAANARLRAAVEAKDTEIVMLRSVQEGYQGNWTCCGLRSPG